MGAHINRIQHADARHQDSAPGNAECRYLSVNINLIYYE